MFAWILFASILFAVMNNLIVRSKLFAQNCSLRIKNVLDGSSKVNHLNIYKTIHLRVNSLVTTEILTKKISPIFYLCKLDNTSSNVLWFIAMTSLSQWILKLLKSRPGWKVVRWKRKRQHPKFTTVSCQMPWPSPNFWPKLEVILRSNRGKF